MITSAELEEIRNNFDDNLVQSLVAEIERLRKVLGWYACLRSEIHHIHHGNGQVLSKCDIGHRARVELGIIEPINLAYDDSTKD